MSLRRIRPYLVIAIVIMIALGRGFLNSLGFVSAALVMNLLGIIVWICIGCTGIFVPSSASRFRRLMDRSVGFVMVIIGIVLSLDTIQQLFGKIR